MSYLSSPNAIPRYNREWLRQLRSLFGYTHQEMGDACGLSYITYAGLENPHKSSYRMATYRTMRKVAEEFGINTSMFFYKTDDETGKLCTKDSIVDTLMLFKQHGFEHMVNNDTFIRHLFIPEIAEYIIESNLSE